jgi:hypothetical protein
MNIEFVIYCVSDFYGNQDSFFTDLADAHTEADERSRNHGVEPDDPDIIVEPLFVVARQSRVVETNHDDEGKVVLQVDIRLKANQHR